jgi:uncharacterized protein YigE (DUF2233 family)
MKKTIFTVAVILCLSGAITGCDRTQEGELGWKPVKDGISYAAASIRTGNGDDRKDVILVSINPRKYQLSIFENNDEKSALTIKEIHQQNKSLATFNGNFFTEDFKPTGLLISNGQTLRDLSGSGLLNGVMTIDENNKASLIDTENFSRNKYTFAIQNGPVLLDQKGNIVADNDSKDKASRTAVGIDQNGNLIVVMIKQSLLNMNNEITLHDFAQMLKDAPEFSRIGLKSVLNLDGGTSSGLMIGETYYPELTKIQNTIIVKEIK